MRIAMTSPPEEIESLISRALQRVPPPEGLEQRILTAVIAGKPASPIAKHRPWLALAAGLAMAVSTSGYLAHRHYQTKKATEQPLFALELTSQKLNQYFDLAMHEAQERVDRALNEEKKP
jgi:hypothetical protein